MKNKPAQIEEGKIIKLYFICADMVSEEERTIQSFDTKTIVVNTTLHPDSGGEEYEKFDRKTGMCLNDNTMFGSRRYIDPQ